MKAGFLTLAAGSVLAVSGFLYANAQAQDMDTTAKPDKVVQLTAKNNMDAGDVEIHYGKAGILLKVKLQGMSEGWHAFHIHEKGDCSAADYKSAGSHTGHSDSHGLLDEEVPHPGDLPNIWVGGTGAGKAHFFTTFIDEDGLSDEDGSAFVLHEGADDYRTDSAGDAGGRVACGVIFPDTTADE